MFYLDICSKTSCCMKLSPVVIAAVVVFSAAPAQSSIECYSCDYPGDDGCGEDFNPSGSGVTTIECPEACGKIYVSGLGETTITRSCSTSLEDLGCRKAKGVKACIKSCTTSLCNSAIPRAPLSTFAIFTTIFLVFARFIY